jgi:predicted dehydrogenase
VTGVDFCYRYYPVVQEAAARIRHGEMGKVRIIHGTWFQDWLSTEDDYSWRLEKKENGTSNVMADLGSHWFDLTQKQLNILFYQPVTNSGTMMQ